MTMKGTQARRVRPLLLASLLVAAMAVPAQTAPRWEGPAQSAQVPSQPVASQPVWSQPQQPPQARPLPFDVMAFETMAQQLVNGHRIPGLAMAIVRDGRIVSARGYGVTDVDAPQPVDAHTVFRLASLSKPFAGTVTAMLVGDGRLRWDQPVTSFMPDFRMQWPEAGNRLTLADLLSHRTGLTRNAYDRDIEAGADFPSLTRKLAQAPMTCAPGNCYAYQNVAFSLVGDAVHAATGEFFGNAVARRIFQPLGMHDASYGLEGILGSQRWARPHVRRGGGWRAVTPKPTYYRVGPAAGVNASAADMAQWLLAQTGHRPDVIGPALLATVQSPQVATPTELRGSAWRRERLSSASYGLGWRVYDYAGHRMVFHGGAVQGYRGAIAVLPDRDVGIAILWNSESSLPSGLMPTIIDSALGLPAQAWLKLETGTSASDAPQYTGEAAGSSATRATAAPQ